MFAVMPYTTKIIGLHDLQFYENKTSLVIFMLIQNKEYVVSCTNVFVVFYTKQRKGKR